jgi:hypothetical protein
MRELLGHPKDMMATTGLEIMNVNRSKTSYMTLLLNMDCIKIIFNYIHEGAIKWVISSRAYSRAKKLVINAERLNTLLNFDLQKCAARPSGWQFAYHAKRNGIASITKSILISIGKVIGYGQDITDLRNLKAQKLPVENTERVSNEKTERKFTQRMECGVIAAGRTTSFFLLSIMSIAMVISNVKAANIQMVRSFMISLLSKAFQIIISCFVTTAIWAERVIMGFALIGKVQRLSLRRVRSSDRMYALPLWGKDIVPSV